MIPTRPRTGIIFRPGDYGKKGKYTDADIDAMCGDINVPIRMSHHDTLLDGKLGDCKRAFAGFDDNGKKVLLGEWDEPEPLAQLLGNTPRKVSAEIDLETMSLVAVALEVNPHIKDAAFFSASVDCAYAKFSAGEPVEPLAQFAYESASERDKIPDADFGDPANKLFPCRTQSEFRQCMAELANADDPTAVKERLIKIATRKGLNTDTDNIFWPTRGVSKPIDGSDGSMAYSVFTAASTKEKKMSQEAPKGFFAQLKAAFSGASDEELAQLGVAPTAPVAKEPEKSAREIELEQQLAKFEADKVAAEKNVLSAAAAAFADELVKEEKVVAKGNDAYNVALGLFAVAQAHDAAKPALACFSDEDSAKFSAVDALKAVFAGLPKHSKNQEQTAGGDKGLVALFGTETTTVTDPETGEIQKFNMDFANKIIERRKQAAA